MWRDRWWRMFDRDPIETWVYGRIALLGDAAHPPLQYIAQGAIMAIEDGYVLAEHLAPSHGRRPDRLDAALAAYQAVRPEHCRRVLTTSRAWGELWHLDGDQRGRRNQILRARDPHDYSFTDWLYSTTALTPSQEPAPYRPVPLDSVEPAPDPGQPDDVVGRKSLAPGRIGSKSSAGLPDVGSSVAARRSRIVQVSDAAHLPWWFPAFGRDVRCRGRPLSDNG